MEEDSSNGYHGDDLMTPPDVLLQLSMKEAEKAANHDVINKDGVHRNLSLYLLV